MSGKRERIHIFVSGKVQGVGFRQATWRHARSLGLTGWVRNTEDGRVEIEAEGDAETLTELLEWCGTGPGHARVVGVEIIARGPSDARPGARAEFQIL